MKKFKFNRHKTFKYIILFIYIYNINDKIENLARIFFLKKIHIVDDLKINILINNNIIKLENIIVSHEKRTIHIENCDVTILIKI